MSIPDEAYAAAILIALAVIVSFAVTGYLRTEEEKMSKVEVLQDIETRIRYHKVPQVDSDGTMTVVHRTDYYEDGSQSEYYYIEITEELFKELTQ